MRFLNALKEKILLFDGAMGTQIQGLDLNPEVWQGKQGLNELLNLTAPEEILKIHSAYLSAGSDIIETNTFGANRIVLSEYGMAESAAEINYRAALIAGKAVETLYRNENRTAFVAGSIGPGTKLPSLGQIDFDSLYSSYLEQAQSLIKGGVDLLLIETCQDLLQIKTAVIAGKDAARSSGISVPIAVSFTVESSGALLIGSDIGAVVTVLSALGVDILGINCALGPEQMRPFIRQLRQLFPGPVLCQPNAGLPENLNGRVVYNLPPEDFAESLCSFVSQEGVNLVGGCCGTTPVYIACLAEGLRKVSAKTYTPPPQEPRIASLFSSVSLIQEPKPFFVGERNNTSGSRDFKNALLSEDWDSAVQIALSQEETGAHGIDLCVAYAGRNEKEDMKKAVETFSTRISAPLFFDSTNPSVLEEGLKRYGGRGVINSINLEDGEEKAREVLALAARYGAAVIALTIDEKGMAKERENKLAIAKRLAQIAFDEYGLPQGSLIIDPLTFTLGSGDSEIRDSARQTLLAIGDIKKEIPGALTVLGVSNVSFGLSPEAREVLTSVFLKEAAEAGLDLAIINVKKIIPLHTLTEDIIKAALELIYPGKDAYQEPLLHYISLFSGKEKSEEETASAAVLSPEDSLKGRIIKGNKKNLLPLLEENLKIRSASEIINSILIPAMKTVGEYFGQGKMQLPFVLQSAETMKESVKLLEPFMEKSGQREAKKVVLATVRGDVHDIGKNLVDIILSNNGYEVHNLGIKCEAETIIQKAEEIKADAVGMSGLLVKSAEIMKENIREMVSRKLEIPVLLGGAALTERFVAEECAPLSRAPVYYCKDAFDGLKALEDMENNKTPVSGLKPIKEEDPPAKVLRKSLAQDISANIPEPTFFGVKLLENIALEDVFPLLSKNLLFKVRWGYGRGHLDEDEYRELLKKRINPEFQELKERCAREALFQPKAVYGFFRCRRDKDEITLLLPGDMDNTIKLPLPRQTKPPYLSLADYFKPGSDKDDYPDILALQAVTLGAKASEKASELFRQNHYKDYLLLHGLSVETTEALAEYLTTLIRRNLSFTAPYSGKSARGKRYSFGYPTCPDLAGNKTILDILGADRIGIGFTESEQMIPEMSTCAFFIHNPQAEYFKL